MAITLKDPVSMSTITVKPYRIISTTRYAVKPVLYPVVVSVGKESIRKEIFFKILDSDTTTISFLNGLADAVNVSASDHPEVPVGSYYVEAIEYRHEANNVNILDVRLSMFMYE